MNKAPMAPSKVWNTAEMAKLIVIKVWFVKLQLCSRDSDQ